MMPDQERTKLVETAAYRFLQENWILAELAGASSRGAENCLLSTCLAVIFSQLRKVNVKTPGSIFC